MAHCTSTANTAHPCVKIWATSHTTTWKKPRWGTPRSAKYMPTEPNNAKQEKNVHHKFFNVFGSQIVLILGSHSCPRWHSRKKAHHRVNWKKSRCQKYLEKCMAKLCTLVWYWVVPWGLTACYSLRFLPPYSVGCGPSSLPRMSSFSCVSKNRQVQSGHSKSPSLDWELAQWEM